MIVDDRALAAALDPIPADWDEQEGQRLAAVCVPVVRIAGVEHLVFTRRRDDLPHHAGQVSFPGGVMETGEDPTACALRETREEIGAVAARLDVLGALKTRNSIAGFRVHSLVARLDHPEDLVPEVREVAAILRAPLAELRRDELWRDHPMPGYPDRITTGFDLGGALLWGLTGRMTRELLSRLGG